MLKSMKANIFKRAMSTVLAATLAIGTFVFTANAEVIADSPRTTFGSEAATSDYFALIGKTEHTSYDYDAENKKITAKVGDNDVVQEEIVVHYEVYANEDTVDAVQNINIAFDSIPGLGNRRLESKTPGAQILDYLGQYMIVIYTNDDWMQPFTAWKPTSTDPEKTTGFVMEFTATYAIDNAETFINYVKKTDDETNASTGILGLSDPPEVNGMSTYTGHIVCLDAETGEQMDLKSNFVVKPAEFKLNEQYEITYVVDSRTGVTPEKQYIKAGESKPIPSGYEIGFTANAEDYILIDWTMVVEGEGAVESRTSTVAKGATLSPTANATLTANYDTEGVGPWGEHGEILVTYKVRNTTGYNDTLGIESIDWPTPNKDATKESAVVAVKKANREDTKVKIGESYPKADAIKTKDGWDFLGYYDAEGKEIKNVANVTIEEGKDNVIYIYLKKGDDPKVDERKTGDVTVTYPGVSINGEDPNTPVVLNDAPIAGPVNVLDKDGNPLKDANDNPITGKVTPNPNYDPENPATHTGTLPLDQLGIPEEDDERHPIEGVTVEVGEDKDGNPTVEVKVEYAKEVPKNDVTTEDPIIDGTKEPEEEVPGGGKIKVEKDAIIIFLNKDGDGAEVLEGSTIKSFPANGPFTLSSSDYPPKAATDKLKDSEGNPFDVWKFVGDKDSNGNSCAFEPADPHPYLNATDHAEYMDKLYYVMVPTFKKTVNTTVTKPDEEGNPVTIIDDKPVPSGTTIKVVDPTSADPTDPTKPLDTLKDKDGNPIEKKVDKDNPNWNMTPEEAAKLDDAVPPRNGDEFYTGELEAEKDANGNPVVKTDPEGNPYVELKPKYDVPDGEDIIIDPIVDPTDDPNTYGIDANNDGYVVLAGNFMYKNVVEKEAKAYFKASVMVNNKPVEITEGDEDHFSASASRSNGYEPTSAKPNGVKTEGYFGSLSDAGFKWDPEKKAFYITYNMEKSGIIDVLGNCAFGNTSKEAGKYTAIMVGDVDKNGTVNSMDIVALNKHLVGGNKPKSARLDENTKYDYEISNIDKNSSLNSMDIVALNKMIVTPGLKN
jgi:hypothetical protein